MQALRRKQPYRRRASSGVILRPLSKCRCTKSLCVVIIISYKYCLLFLTSFSISKSASLSAVDGR